MFSTPLPYKATRLQSHSISAGNPSGQRAVLPPGEQAKHYISISAGETATLAEIDGPGMLRSFWLTVDNLSPEALRSYVIRIYWDNAEHPSVEAPLGDFFGLAHGRVAHYHTPYLGVSEGKGFNSFFPMPFAKHCRITLENDSPNDEKQAFYQINYTLGDVITDDTLYFHCHFRREIPALNQPYVLVDIAGSAGALVGMNVSALPQSKGTWREGEFRVYFDGEQQASIVGTGWSDWFLSAWGLGIHQSAYAGSNYQVMHPTFANEYFCSSYRFFVQDPIYFDQGLRLEHDTRGFLESDFEPRADDWCSTVYWYQHLTANALPALPPRAERVEGVEFRDFEKDEFSMPSQDGVVRDLSEQNIFVEAGKNESTEEK